MTGAALGDALASVRQVLWAAMSRPPERGSKNGGQGVELAVAGSPLRSDRFAVPGMTSSAVVPRRSPRERLGGFSRESGLSREKRR